MRHTIRAAVLSSMLAVTMPAAAQYTFTQPGQPPQPVQQLQVWNNVARVNLGVSFFNSGYYNCNYWGGYYPTTPAAPERFVSYIPFTVGPQVDFNLEGMNNISVGFNVFLGTATGTLYSGNLSQSVSKSVTVWEPTIDYVAKFGPADAGHGGPVPRRRRHVHRPQLQARRGLPHRRRRLVPELEPRRRRPRPRPRGRRLPRATGSAACSCVASPEFHF